MHEILEWHDRFSRCPWGPKAEHLRHVQMASLNGYKGMKIKDFNHNSTHEKREELRIELYGIEGSELTKDQAEENAQMQAEWAKTLKAMYCNKGK